MNTKRNSSSIFGLSWRNFNVSVLFTVFYLHRPGQSRFEEKWLKDIVETKMIVISKIDF